MNLKGFEIEKTSTFVDREKELQKRYKNIIRDVDDFVIASETKRSIAFVIAKTLV